MGDFSKLMAYRKEVNAFAKLLHIEAMELREGYAKAVMPIGEELRNPQGAVHGGVLYTLADVAGGSAAASHGEWIARWTPISIICGLGLT